MLTKWNELIKRRVDVEWAKKKKEKKRKQWESLRQLLLAVAALARAGRRTSGENIWTGKRNRREMRNFWR